MASATSPKALLGFSWALELSNVPQPGLDLHCICLIKVGGGVWILTVDIIFEEICVCLLLQLWMLDSTEQMMMMRPTWQFLIKFESFNNCQCGGFMFPAAVQEIRASHRPIKSTVRQGATVGNTNNNNLYWWQSISQCVRSLHDDEAGQGIILFRETEMSEWVVLHSAKIANLFAHYSTYTAHPDDDSRGEARTFR